MKKICVGSTSSIDCGRYWKCENCKEEHLKTDDDKNYTYCPYCGVKFTEDVY